VPDCKFGLARSASATASETAQGGSRQSGQDPVPAQPRAEGFVEVNRRGVPVQHRPLHAPASPADGDARQGREQGAAGAPTALVGQHEEILEVERRAGQERGVGEEIEREADGRAVALADERVEVAPWAEAVTTDATKARLAFAGQPLVLREPPDEAKDGGDVAPCTRSNP